MQFGRNEQPIFLVGAPRSGTTLLAAMLAAHSRLSCGPETDFFRFLSQTDPGLLCAPQSWPNNAVEFLFWHDSPDALRKPTPHHFGISRQQIDSYLRQRPPTVAAILSALTEQHMVRVGKQRWVEKTPNHTLYVHDIRNHFPESPVIRIVRDPRDAALSITKVPREWAPRDFLGALGFWHHYDNQSAEFFQTDKKCYTLRYEDLVKSPETALRKLCSFLGEEYEHSMLDTSESAVNIVTEYDAPWHRIVGTPVDKTRAYVWKREISQEQNRLAEALVGDRLKAYGYERSEHFERVACVFPSLNELWKYSGALGSLVEEGIRFWHASDTEECHATVFVGDPDKDAWLGNERWERLTGTFRITARILKERLSNRRIYWVHDRHTYEKLGRCSRVLAFFLTLTGRTL